MLFNSVHFFVFLPIVLLIYFFIPLKKQKFWLLICSLYFYAVFEVPFLLLLLFCIFHTYSFTYFLSKSSNKNLKKLYLSISIFGNLAILYFFKYIDFSIDTYNSLFGFTQCEKDYVAPLGVILPMGISFFVLQAISYSVDVYRNVIPIHHNVWNFSLFLSFFPQLVAGPIIRAKVILHQFEEKHSFSKENFYEGLKKLTMGFFKKIILADPISQIVDPIFLSPSEYGWYVMWLAVFLFAIQIYCDFSGYSDIAIGTAKIMGFSIPENFSRPFLAINLSELWKRWHISLSSWLKDYIYIPLGGSQKGVFITYLNLFITMVVSGLWHGAEATVVVWGIFHALCSVIEKFLFSFNKIRDLYKQVPFYIKWFYPFFIFSFALFFFRAKPIEGFSGIEVSFFMIEKAFSLDNGNSISIPFSVIFSICLLFGIEISRELKFQFLRNLEEKKVLMYFISLLVLSLCFLIFAVSVSSPFIYFQF